jgi:hypothetical protein
MLNAAHVNLAQLAQVAVGLCAATQRKEPMSNKIIHSLAEYEMNRKHYSIYHIAELAVVWKARFFGLVLVYAVSIAALLAALTR